MHRFMNGVSSNTYFVILIVISPKMHNKIGGLVKCHSHLFRSLWFSLVALSHITIIFLFAFCYVLCYVDTVESLLNRFKAIKVN